MRWFGILLLAIATWAIVAIGYPHRAPAGDAPESPAADATRLDELLPLQVHPLPASLAAWQDENESGDYFDALEPLKVGALLWSRFPVAVWAQAAKPPDAEKWQTAVAAAIAEWNVYLPLETASEREHADILLFPQRVRQRLLPNGELPRARSGEARFDLFVARNAAGAPTLAHKFEILVEPGQAPHKLLGSLRHEIGHALGIWGHSSQSSDALYSTQTSEPPPISARDANTLKKVYQQPTRLGWEIRLEKL